MQQVADSILDLIGNTPIVRLPQAVTGSPANLYCKLEFLNPGGSIKDRMAKHIILTEQERGKISPGDTICDNTSGNAGVGMALVAAVAGYKAVLTTPQKTSREKIDLIKSFGAKVIVTPPDVSVKDPRHCYNVARRLAEENGYYWLNQYDNPLNPEGHYRVTGPEIWKQMEGKITHFVMGIGTGGTISGVGRFLKERNPDIQVVGVDIEGSLFQAIVENRPLGEPRGYCVEGIGTDRLVGAFQRQYVDRVITVSDNKSFLEARALARTTGLSVGGSTGSMFAAARQICSEFDEHAHVLFLACDSGIRYITKFFSDSWMRAHNFELEPEASELVEELKS